MRGQNRILSSDELLANVRRARKLAEHYNVGDANPSDFMDQSPQQQASWDALLNQIK
jgi:hypothetical protein